MTPIEEKIQKIFDTADELRVLLGLSTEYTGIKIQRGQGTFWHVSVRPSLMTFGDKFTHLMERGYSEKTLNEAFDSALAGTIEEIDLYKKGMTRGLK